MLQKILKYNEAPCDYKNEEDFIKVYLDVIQVLKADREILLHVKKILRHVFSIFSLNSVWMQLSRVPNYSAIL